MQTIKSTNVRLFIAMQAFGLGVRSISSLAPRWGLRWASLQLLRVKPYASTPQVQAQMQRARYRTLHGKGLPSWLGEGLPMQVYRWGEAVHGKIALIHGWNGASSQFLAFIQPLVNAGFQVLAIDAPGHGASAGKHASLPHFAHAIEHLVRSEGGVDGVIAHSLGAQAAVYAAAEQGLQVGKLALISPNITLLEYMQKVVSHMGLGAGLGHRLLHTMENMLGLSLAQLDARLYGASLVQPMLIVHDQDDKEVPLAQVRSLAEQSPQAQMLQTQGLGHRRILQDAGVIARVVQFMRA